MFVVYMVGILALAYLIFSERHREVFNMLTENYRGGTWQTYAFSVALWRIMMF